MFTSYLYRTKTSEWGIYLVASILAPSQGTFNAVIFFRRKKGAFRKIFGKKKATAARASRGNGESSALRSSTQRLLHRFESGILVSRGRMMFSFFSRGKGVEIEPPTQQGNKSSFDIEEDAKIKAEPNEVQVKNDANTKCASLTIPVGDQVPPDCSSSLRQWSEEEKVEESLTRTKYDDSPNSHVDNSSKTHAIAFDGH